MPQEPFFIVGCGRSGTTLFQALIDSHPGISIPPESHVYTRFGRIRHTYGDLASAACRRRLIASLLRDYFIRRWRLEATAAEIEQRVSRGSFAGVVEALFEHYVAVHGTRRWGDKTPGHVRHLHEIRRDFPQAKLIHLVRDGRDVAEAMRRMMFYPVTAIGVAHVWRNDVMHWISFCNAAGTGNTLVVRYEDLVRMPQAVLNGVFDFLDEPSVDAVSTYTDSTLSRNLAAEGPWHDSLRQGIDPGKIGVYRNAFTGREIELLESIEGDALRVYGYAVGHAAPRPPTPGEKLHAFAADRLVRWYRKLHLPRVFWQDLQFRGRVAYRLMLTWFRKSPDARR